MIFLTFVSTHCDKSSQTALLSQSVIQQLGLYHFILIKWPFHPGLPLWPLQLSLLMWMKLEEHVDLAPASLACLHLRICKRNLRSAHVFTVSYGKLVLCTWFPNANVIAWWLGSEQLCMRCVFQKELGWHVDTWHTDRPLLYGAVKFPQKAASHPPVQAVLCCPLLSFVMVCFRSNWSSKWGRKVIYCMYTWRVDVSVSKPAGIFPHSHLYSAQWMVWKGEKNALLMSEVRGECSDCFELRLQLSQTGFFVSPRILLGKICVCLHVHAEEGIFETFKGSHSNLRAEMWPSICFLQQEKLLQRSWLCWC